MSVFYSITGHFIHFYYIRSFPRDQTAQRIGQMFGVNDLF